MLHFSLVDYKALPMILTQAARSLSVLLVIAALSAQESKESLLTKVAPILAGRPEHGVNGATTGTERWIVHFEQRSFELTDFRAAILSRRPAAGVTAIVTGLVAQVKKDQAAFVTAVQSIGGNVVQQWWLVNAAAVEILPTQLLFCVSCQTCHACNLTNCVRWRSLQPPTQATTMQMICRLKATSAWALQLVLLIPVKIPA